MEGGNYVRRLVVGQVLFCKFGQIKPSLEAREVIKYFRENVVELPRIVNEKGPDCPLKEPHQRPKFCKVIVQRSTGQQESVIGRICLELANEPIPASQKWTKDETIIPTCSPCSSVGVPHPRQ